jgi:glycosyltransferase involved in cell wall biosynthesis
LKSDPLSLSRKTIILLALYYPPRNTSGAARPARFAKYFPDYGFDPIPVTEHNAVKSDSGIRVHLASRACWLFQRACLPFEENLPWLPHAYASTVAIMRKTGAGVVFSTSPPIVTHLTALLLKQRYGVRWIADLRDPMTHNPFRRSRRADIYLKWLERAVMRQADIIIANTDALKDLLAAHYPQQAHKIIVIWNGYDPREMLCSSPLPERPYRVLSHVGTLYGGRHPGMLLASLDRLISQGRVNPASLRVKLVGPVEQIQMPLDDPPLAALREKGCIELVNRNVPRSEAYAIMAESDYLLLLDLNASSIDVQVPAKLFEYIQIGRPILCFTSPNSPTERILARAGISYRCIYRDDPPDAVDRQVSQFLTLPTDPMPPSEWFSRSFDARLQTRLLSELAEDPAANGVLQEV